MLLKIYQIYDADVVIFVDDDDKKKELTRKLKIN